MTDKPLHRAVILVLSLLFSLHAFASEEVQISRHIDIDLHDKESLQRGAKFFMNYCSGCHSLKYMRYSQMAKGLGLTNFDGSVDKDLLVNNLIFTKSTIHSPIVVAMPAEDARQWFGMEPPDLSLVARKYSPDWLFSYLTGFYVDNKRPFGANNLLVPDVGMPNVLAPLQGEVFARINEQTKQKELILVQEGEMSQHQFESAVRDLVTFLTYVSEPHQLERLRIGKFVIGFLVVLAIFAYFLKRVYWKRIH